MLNRELVAVFAVGKPMVREVALWPAPDASKQLGSYMMIAADGVFIELLEWSKDETRSASRAAIVDVVAEIARIAELAAEPESADFWRGLFPEGGVATKASLAVQEEAHGHYTIRGFVNPREEGLIRIRAFDVRSGAEIQAEKAAMRRSEYVGWSEDEGVFFPFESYYDAPDVGEDTTVQFEVWFYPVRGTRLLATTRPGIRVAAE